MPRGPDAPAILKDDPRIHKRRKSGWEGVADELLALGGIKDYVKETAYPELLERAIVALMGFGVFDVPLGIGPFGGISPNLFDESVLIILKNCACVT